MGTVTLLPCSPVAATSLTLFRLFLFVRPHPQGVAFMSEFQKMRTMISRMSKQAGLGGPEGAEAEDMVAAYAGGGGGGNRNARRAAKKKGKKGGGGGGMGFGAR